MRHLTTFSDREVALFCTFGHNPHMSLVLTTNDERDVLQAAAIAVVSGLIKQEGTQRTFAKRAKIPLRALQYFLHGERNLRMSTATKLVAALPLEPEQRAHLYEILELLRDERLQQLRHVQTVLQDRSSDEVVAALDRDHDAATHINDGMAAKQACRAVLQANRLVLASLQVATDPLAKVKTYLIAHNLEWIFNQPVNASKHSKYAATIMDLLDPDDYVQEREQFIQLRINTVYAEALSHRHLQHFDQAYAAYLQAEHLLQQYNLQGSVWEVHICQGKVLALSGVPRFSIREAQRSTDQALRLYEARPELYQPAMLLKIKEALARAYIAHANYRQAEQLLREQAPWLHQTTVGVVQRTGYLRTYARCCWHQQRRDEWEYFITTALHTALQAGLTHQLNEIRREYGTHIDPVLQQLRQQA